MKKTAIQTDIKDTQQSELTIPLCDPLMIAPNDYMKTTDNDTNNKKVSMPIPVIQGHLLSNPFKNTQTETTNTVVVFRSFHVIGICPAGTDRSSSPCFFFASAKSLLHRRVYLHDYRLSFFIIFHPRRHGLMGLLCADARDDRPG